MGYLRAPLAPVISHDLVELRGEAQPSWLGLGLGLAWVRLGLGLGLGIAWVRLG